MSGLKGFDIRDLGIGSWPPDPGMNTGSVKHAMVLFLNLALLTPPGVKRCVERAVHWAETEKCSSCLSAQLEQHTLYIYQFV